MATIEPAVGDQVTLTGTIVELLDDVALVRVDGTYPFPSGTTTIAVHLGKLSNDAPSDEDRIRDAMAEAQDHPGRTITPLTMAIQLELVREELRLPARDRRPRTPLPRRRRRRPGRDRRQARRMRADHRQAGRPGTRPAQAWRPLTMAARTRQDWQRWARKGSNRATGLRPRPPGKTRTPPAAVQAR